MLNITIKSVEKVEKNKRATPYMWERAAFELNDSMQKKTPAFLLLSTIVSVLLLNEGVGFLIGFESSLIALQSPLLVKAQCTSQAVCESKG